MTLLIVEDNVKQARVLQQALTEEGHTPVHVPSGEEAIEQVKHNAFDVVLLDWMLPGKDGIELCRELRALDPSLAILMVTARAEVADRVSGLDAGADDYLSKPFELQELYARIRALVRRKTSHEPKPLSAGPLTVHGTERHLILHGQRIDLTAREHAVLLCLVRAGGRVVSRRELLADVWHIRFDPGTNVVDVQVRRLREKLGQYGNLIETVRGSGYRLNAPVETPPPQQP